MYQGQLLEDHFAARSSLSVVRAKLLFMFAVGETGFSSIMIIFLTTTSTLSRCIDTCPDCK